MIIGHMGEVIPFMLARANGALGGGTALGPGGTRMELSLAEYFQRNFHISTSGFLTNPPLLCALEVFGPDRILCATDHPFSANAAGRRFLDEAPIDDGVRAKIAHRNAERLLGIAPQL